MTDPYLASAFPTDPTDGVPLSWSAHPDGVPIRKGDAPPMITRDQLNGAGVRIQGVKAEVLKIPEQMDRYLQIMNWVATGAAVLRFEKERPDPADHAKWVIWVCWCEVRGYINRNQG